MILYHFKKDPDTMEEEEYIKHFRAVDFQMKMQSHHHYVSVRKALTEVVNDMFAKENETEED